MQMLDDWLRVKVWQPASVQSAGLVDPSGKEIERKTVTEDDVFFQIMETGPQVKQVKIGNVAAISFMSNDMFRMQLPGEEFKSFVCRESSVMGILRKQP